MKQGNNSYTQKAMIVKRQMAERPREKLRKTRHVHELN